MGLLVYELYVTGLVSLSAAAATDGLCGGNSVLNGDRNEREGYDRQYGLGIFIHELFRQKQ